MRRPQKKQQRKRKQHKHKKKPGRFPLDKWYLRVEYYDWCCRYCGKKLHAGNITVDHQIPVSRGGTNLPANLVPACEGCNNLKANRTPKEFARFRRRHDNRVLPKTLAVKNKKRIQSPYSRNQG